MQIETCAAEEMNGFFIPRRNADKSNTFLICKRRETPNPVDKRQQQTFISNPPDPRGRAGGGDRTHGCDFEDDSDNSRT